jgi:hypothetical protein
MGKRLPKAGGAIGAVVIAGGTIAYYHFLEEIEKIRGIILHKYQSGEASKEVFIKFFDTEFDPTLIKNIGKCNFMRFEISYVVAIWILSHS